MSYRQVSPIPIVEGGTGAQTLTGVVTGNGTSALTANAVTQYYTLVGGASNAVGAVAPSATAGVPLVSGGSSANPSYTTAVVAGGGTGAGTFTAYALITAGTTATGAFQNVVGVGTAGQVLTSAGASAIPVWSNGASVLTVTPIAHSDSIYVVLSTDQFISADVTAGVIQVNLPNAPTTGRIITVKDVAGLAASSNITLTTVGGAVLIDGATTNVMNTAYQSVTVIFNGSAYSLM